MTLVERKALIWKTLAKHPEALYVADPIPEDFEDRGLDPTT